MRLEKQASEFFGAKRIIMPTSINELYPKNCVQQFHIPYGLCDGINNNATQQFNGSFTKDVPTNLVLDASYRSSDNQMLSPNIQFIENRYNYNQNGADLTHKYV